jgi:hypothetical protein
MLTCLGLKFKLFLKGLRNIRKKMTKHPIQQRDNRVNTVVPVFVHARKKNGAPKRLLALTNNISQSGVSLELTPLLNVGSLVFTLIYLSRNLRLAARGTVVRISSLNKQPVSAAISFTYVRIITVSLDS